MFKFLFNKSNKKLLLGRWNVNKNLSDINRKIDLANCDQCGTCNIPDYKKKIEKVIIEDDVIDINIPISSFDVYPPKK